MGGAGTNDEVRDDRPIVAASSVGGFWGIVWRQRSAFGEGSIVESLIVGDPAGPYPLLFRTRREARAFIKSRYGYIATRKDLRGYGHGWRMPQPVRVRISIDSVTRFTKVPGRNADNISEASATGAA